MADKLRRYYILVLSFLSEKQQIVSIKLFINLIFLVPEVV